ELERVIAVRVTPEGNPESLVEPRAWLELVDRDRQVPTHGVWERDFAHWSEGREEQCRATASESFGAISDAFASSLSQELSAERAELERWLSGRADDLCGERAQQLGFDQQLGLGFDRGEPQLELARTDL